MSYQPTNADRRARNLGLLAVSAGCGWVMAKLVLPPDVHIAVVPTLAALGARHFMGAKREGEEHEPKHPAVKFMLVAWNEGDFSEAEKHVASDVVISVNGDTRDATSAAGGPGMAQESIQYWRSMAPDIKMELLSEIRHKDRIAIEWRLQGTHTGERPELPATGNPIDIEGAAFLTLDDDKIAEVSTVFDALSLVVLMGTAEAPGWLRPDSSSARSRDVGGASPD